MRSQNARLANYLTVRQIKDHLSVSEKTVRRWIAKGDLPHHHFGTAIRVCEDDFLTFVGGRRR